MHLEPGNIGVYQYQACIEQMAARAEFPVISALTAGLCGDLGLGKTIEAFTGGLGGGAEVAMNYAMLGAFAIAISKSGSTMRSRYYRTGEWKRHEKI